MVFRTSSDGLNRVAQQFSSPINDKLRKNHPFNFKMTVKEIEAIASSQDKLFSSPVLGLSCVEWQFKLDTDACDVPLGCVFLQEKPEKMTTLVTH